MMLFIEHEQIILNTNLWNYTNIFLNTNRTNYHEYFF